MAEEEIVLSDPSNRITWSHEEIKNWIERHNGKPAIFDDPTSESDKIGIRIDFEGKEDEKYMESGVKTEIVEWEKFFEIFDKRKLAFIYNDQKEPRDVTMAYLLVPRKNLEKYL
jgi:hypothetical protein